MMPLSNVLLAPPHLSDGWLLPFFFTSKTQDHITTLNILFFLSLFVSFLVPFLFYGLVDNILIYL